jgi:demethylspheroidene O-methyltransferase
MATDSRPIQAPHKGPAAARPSWRERWLQWRDRRLADPAFQRWAAQFPLTRRLVRRRAEQLFDLCAGFVYSQVLLACVQLRLFERLGGGPQSAADLAAAAGLEAEALRRLLDAAVALDLLDRRGGPAADPAYGLGIHGAALRGNPGVLALIEHHALLYADLADPLALVRRGRGAALADYWAYAGADDPARLQADQVGRYSALMAASQPLVADDILDAYPLTSHRCLLDVGGGEGAFVTAVARRAPHLRLLLFDLPAVAARAGDRLAAAPPHHPSAQPIQVYGGDYHRDPLPRGADLVTLVRVLHDHNDTHVLALLRAVHAALPQGGRILIAEPLADPCGSRRVGDAYFGMYLLAMGRGRPRTAAQLCSMLQCAGFSHPQVLPTRRPWQTGLVTAESAG